MTRASSEGVAGRHAEAKKACAPAEGAGPAIDLNDHIATRIAIFANRVSRAASRFYRERYDIGVVEWRVLMFVGRANETSANRICSETDLDKGAVSRSLNVLARMGAVSVKADGADSRRHNVALTAKGRALHDRIVPVALERQRDLLHDLSPAEVETLKDIIAPHAGQSGDSKALRGAAVAKAAAGQPARAQAFCPAGRIAQAPCDGTERVSASPSRTCSSGDVSTLSLCAGVSTASDTRAPRKARCFTWPDQEIAPFAGFASPSMRMFSGRTSTTTGSPSTKASPARQSPSQLSPRTLQTEAAVAVGAALRDVGR